MEPTSPPAVSVIIPVYNESHQVQYLVDHLAEAAAGVAFEIIMVDGCPDGSSIRALRQNGIITVKSPLGRAAQMNAGAARASAPVLLFLHADTRLPPGAMGRILDAVSSGHRAGAFDLRYQTSRRSVRLIARVACLRSRLTRIPYGDQAQFFRRDYFESLGRFAPIPLMEDVEIMRRIKKRGDRIVILRECVQTSARRQEKEGALYCTVRNWTLVSLYLMGVSPDRLASFYRNH